MDQQGIRATLNELQLSQGALARLLKQLGDQADPLTIRRRVERWCQGVSNVPGEAAAFLNLLRTYPDVLADLMAQQARAQAKAQREKTAARA